MASVGKLARATAATAFLLLGAGVVWMVGGSAAAEDPYANTPPNCTAVAASPSSLTQMGIRDFVVVTLSGATDDDGDALTYHIDGVTQDEPVSGAADATSPDAQFTTAGADSNQVSVRAERNPMGNGRVYRIAVTVSDGSATCSGVAKVSVPRKKGTTAVDDGDSASWNSFTGAPV